MVNASMAHARLGNRKEAEAYLARAIRAAPESGVAHFNMGLLKAEQQDFKSAESHFRSALEKDLQLGAAAFNLGLLLAGQKRYEEALSLLQKACSLEPTAAHGYALAFYRFQSGDRTGAIDLLGRKHREVARSRRQLHVSE